MTSQRPPRDIGLALLVLAALSGCAHRPAESQPPALLLISIDGLRPRDITPEQMPNLSRLAESGVRAEGMRPSYPSLTFPNHYTLVTGLRPDRHGITHNSMRDHELGEFRLSRREAVEDGRWWGGEPIWSTAEKAGLRTATLYWPGSEASIAGMRPRQWHHFDAATTPQWRAGTVADWLLAPAATRPAFATLYFDKVDHASHHHGPDSPEARHERHDTDAAIGQLLERLREAGALARTNIVVVSDHGLAEVPPGNVVAVEDMATVEEARVDSLGQVVTFAPNPGFTAQVEKRLLGRHSHYQCWKKAELPPRWHYGRHPRVPPIVCQMDEGWDALPRAQLEKRRAEGMRGSHGYDPALPSMRASFIAHGPAFRPGARLPVFDNVDVYPLLMKLIGLRPGPNEGDARTFAPALTGR
ncbi:alkaline phosphatase family protein [Lysobacter pythonis]|uniref:Alkaline phosphatase family protein n=1 Tax=Solilutibacter pythonis TaxID=2483112 RepID=A0A3M2I1S7_9GAMM|nr:ectonucleotide pyrophosphatase/phosphodiesterase [Lysobacter pythonis]RMH93569.1 alkaline phosphatase family protein [Lysobacter pythonis]